MGCGCGGGYSVLLILRISSVFLGNTVEWSYPKGHNLEGLEFKSLASGLHNVTRDFM